MDKIRDKKKSINKNTEKEEIKKRLLNTELVASECQDALLRTQPYAIDITKGLLECYVDEYYEYIDWEKVIWILERTRFNFPSGMGKTNTKGRVGGYRSTDYKTLDELRFAIDLSICNTKVEDIFVISHELAHLFSTDLEYDFPKGLNNKRLKCGVEIYNDKLGDNKRRTIGYAVNEGITHNIGFEVAKKYISKNYLEIEEKDYFITYQHLSSLTKPFFYILGKEFITEFFDAKSTSLNDSLEKYLYNGALEELFIKSDEAQDCRRNDDLEEYTNLIKPCFDMINQYAANAVQKIKEQTEMINQIFEKWERFEKNPIKFILKELVIVPINNMLNNISSRYTNKKVEQRNVI